ncbi:MAG: hypothetical protein HW397_657 [Dehalococcoidia bacterium]|nr:hypothetical protein [Dehalococcoidia bacterium]
MPGETVAPAGGIQAVLSSPKGSLWLGSAEGDPDDLTFQPNADLLG